MTAKEAWWERGRCRDYPFPQVFERVEQVQWRRQDWSTARELCASCKVTKQCLEYTLDQPSPILREEMFAAGYTPQEIAVLRRYWERHKRKVARR